MKLLRAQGGQAAVETVFSIPIFLVLFLIGFQLFAITWNSQYAHVTSRYKAIHTADHHACIDSSGHKMPGLNSKGILEMPNDSADVTTDVTMLPNSPGSWKITNNSYIECK